MTTTPQSLSAERKLRMYEAREALLGRIGSETFSVINLDHFLRAAVTEVGKIMEVDGCDLITPLPDGELRVSHEYRRQAEGVDLPSALELALRVSLEKVQETIDLYHPRAIEDVNAPDVSGFIRTIAENLGSKSILLVPITSNFELLAIVALHHVTSPHHWDDSEVQFVRGLAQQIAIGFRYIQMYSEKEKEARVNEALLEIANDINVASDFAEVTGRILDKALDLLRIQGACLALLDVNNGEIHFTNLRTTADTPGVELKRPSLKLPIQEMLPKTVEHGQMLRILSPDQHEYARIFLTQVVAAGAAIIAPIVIENRLFGALVLMWARPRTHFTKDDAALALGISDQLAIAISKARLSAEVLRLRRELENAQSEQSDIGFVGKSDSVRRCIEMAAYVADSYTTVLLQGNSGTGKEMLANMIQSRSSRSTKPYVKINCGAIPESLLESELFGHEKGAFTDARSRRIGKFEEANGGTLFLDEIAEMTLPAQVRLLRVLQNGEFSRVGGNEVVKTDVRVIAASNIDLEEAVKQGRFRRDLFYRLNVYPIKLPPLVERRDDIPLLAIHFLEIYRKRANKNLAGITDKALARLRHYDWPGNVRELENAIERAVIIAQGPMITVDDLPDALSSADSEGDPQKTVAIEIGATMDDIEKRIILETLSFTRGDKSRTAQILGIGRKTLYRKLQLYSQDEGSK